MYIGSLAEYDYLKFPNHVSIGIFYLIWTVAENMSGKLKFKNFIFKLQFFQKFFVWL